MRKGPIFDMTLPKKIPYLVPYLPDTVSKGQVNFCYIFTKLKKDLDLCLWFLILAWFWLGFCFCFGLGFFYFILWFPFLSWVWDKEEPGCRGTSCPGWCVNISLTHCSSFMSFQLWQVECPEWSLIRLPLLIFSSLQLSSRKIVTSKSKQRGKCRVWETMDL